MQVIIGLPVGTSVPVQLLKTSDCVELGDLLPASIGVA